MRSQTYESMWRNGIVMAQWDPDRHSTISLSRNYPPKAVSKAVPEATRLLESQTPASQTAAEGMVHQNYQERGTELELERQAAREEYDRMVNSFPPSELPTPNPTGPIQPVAAVLPQQTSLSTGAEPVIGRPRPPQQQEMPTPTQPPQAVTPSDCTSGSFEIVMSGLARRVLHQYQQARQNSATHVQTMQQLMSMATSNEEVAAVEEVSAFIRRSEWETM